MHKTLQISLALTMLLLAACTAAPAALPTASAPDPDPTETAVAQPSPSLTAPARMPTRPPSPFTLYGEGPIIERGPEGTWDSLAVYPIGVVREGDSFYLFRRGFASGLQGVGYATSADGFNWERVGGDPVFTGEGLALEAPGANPTDLRIEDGRWILTCWGSREGMPRHAAIWQATAPGPDGPWTFDTTALLDKGVSTEWDGWGVLVPVVIRAGDGWSMFYDGYNLARDRDTDYIGMATSADGITWTKYDDPATVDSPYRDSDPVFGPGEPGAWDDRSVQNPEVVLTPDGLVMAYLGFDEGGNPASLGLARSVDGIHWERHPANPVITLADVPGADYLHVHNFFYHEGRFYLFSEAGEGDYTDIWLFVADAPLVWG